MTICFCQMHEMMENGGGDAFGVDGGDSTDTAAAGVGHNEIDWSGGEAAAVGRERLGGQQRQQVQNSSFVIQNSSFLMLQARGFVLTPMDFGTKDDAICT